MTELTLEIKPKVGFGELKFGCEIDEVVKTLGEAEDVEDIQEEEDFNTVILNYWEKGYSIFIEGYGAEKSSVACIETDNEDATLFGQKVFSLNEEQIVDLMKKEGYKEMESDTEDNGEYRLSFEDALMDFFFEDKKLIAINWGVILNELGEVEDL